MAAYAAYYVVCKVAIILDIAPIMGRIRDAIFLGEFGRRCREARTAKGMTLEDVADLAGIDSRQVSRVEKGTINATLSTAVAIGRALGVPLSSLFDDQP